MADTSIQFADKVWNPTTGCTMGCSYCYARRIANRHLPQGGFTDREFTEVRFHVDRLVNPLKWKKPQTIFVDSMGDLFDPHVDWDWFYQIVSVMLNASRHTFLVFTKFAARMEQFVNSRDIERLVSGRKTDHIIWCATAENQFAADARLGHVCALKWGRKGVSIEPMKGSIDLRAYLPHRLSLSEIPGIALNDGCTEMWSRGLDWVVCGGQTGSDAKPIHPVWVYSLRKQCELARVPFFFKQWGEWKPTDAAKIPGKHTGGDIFLELDGSFGCQGGWWYGTAAAMDKVGKKVAGCLLDGVEYKQYPEVLA